MDEPLVSVIMNCFNGEEYLSEALDSVLEQTYDNWELVFWDNLSTDRSSNIFHSIDDPRFHYFLTEYHTNLGQARAEAWKKAKGEFVAILDVDDIWFPNKLEKQLKLFRDPSVGMVISDTFFFNKNRRWKLYGKNIPPSGYVFNQLLADYFVSLETLVLRKSTVDSLGYSFDPRFSHIADFDLVLRTAMVSELEIVGEVLASWRIHENNESKLSPNKFFVEKKEFLRKLDSLDILETKNYKRARKQFAASISRSEAIQLLIDGNRWMALRVLHETFRVDWKTVVLIFACFLPFSRIIISQLRDH